MPTLDWIGKDAVIKHHKDVPFRLLEPNEELSCGDSSDGNLIVQGDNLHALKALLPKYAGKVKCIYIDPPYNTGKEGWVYNDNVKSPEIQKWLGDVVGKEAEDLSRHDKWLCMMYPRMVLLKQFLKDDGAIFVSIDDNEVASLRLLMDEIFGKKQFLGDIIWQHSVQPKGYRDKLSLHHNHTIFYGGNNFSLGELERTDEDNVNYSNPDNDPNGPWRSGDVRNSLHRPNCMYDIEAPNGNIIKHPPNGWRFQRSTFEEELARGKIIFSEDQTKIKRKIYLRDQTGRGVESIWFGKEAGTTREANSELKDILNGLDFFETPKPTRLIQRILAIASDKDSIIMDSFAGSGTTGHAVLKQNQKDSGSRKYILVEMDDQIAQSITHNRLKRATLGYESSGNEKQPLYEEELNWSTLKSPDKHDSMIARIEEARDCNREAFDSTKVVIEDAQLKVIGETSYDEVKGLGGGFQYCSLSEEPLFNEFGDIRDDVTFAQLADFVWFAETGIGYTGEADSPLLGVHDDTAIYLLFNGILEDRHPQGGNILTKKILDDLPEHDGAKVVYAAATRLGAAALQRANIIFKQTPYAIEV